MSTALTIVPVDDLVSLAEKLAPSTLLPEKLRGKIADVLAIVLAGRELGLAPMASLRCLNVIEGKAVLNADGMVGVVRGSGKCESFEMDVSTDAIATFSTQRKGGKVQRLSFTIEEARRANLTNKDNWKKYPAAMLRARAQAALCRLVYQDVLAGVYSDDEAAEFSRSSPPRGLAPVHEFRAPDAEVIEAEVVEPAPVVDVGYALLVRINEAESIAELGELIGTLKAYEGGDKAALRKAYSARRAKLLEPREDVPARTDEEAAEAAR